MYIRPIPFSSAAEDCFQFKGPLYTLATDISRVGTEGFGFVRKEGSSFPVRAFHIEK
jgi:hypothetical protein